MTKLAHIMFALGLCGLLAAGCGKAEEAEGGDKATEMAEKAKKEAETAAAAAKMKAEEEAKKAEAMAKEKAAMTANYVKIIANHEPKTETDPAIIMVEKFEVTKAEFDPANLEGGMVEMSLDLNSIKSDKDKRDGHLKTPDYLDTAQFAMANVKIMDVKKDGEKYAAKAEVSAHGVSKTFPVSFEVVESMDDGVRIKAMHKFSRLDFGIGKEPDGDKERVATELTIEMQLTIKKSA